MTEVVVNGVRYKKFLFTYPFNGKKWCGEVYAQSWEEAGAKMKAMGWGKIDGEHVASIPASVGSWVPLLVWLRNLFVLVTGGVVRRDGWSGGRGR